MGVDGSVVSSVCTEEGTVDGILLPFNEFSDSTAQTRKPGLSSTHGVAGQAQAIRQRAVRVEWVALQQSPPIRLIRPDQGMVNRKNKKNCYIWYAEGWERLLESMWGV